MARDREADSLVFRFAVVVALAMSILVLLSLATPPKLANNSAAPLPSNEAVYRAQHLNLF
jgi:hypothetical protein